ncbi:ELM2 domain-containing protein [Rhynchospora pubera]|uniref:ELM2 domain-containing protein n=1 Tax=Rhynchospora pubera TaxID=906938 RepID=A0AAV8CVA7_9POAL|nr:ELM2 domain-containing protein [Rhynchospora pubera]
MGALALGAPDILRSLKSVGLCTNLDAPPDQSQLTFDQVLSAFYQDLSHKGELSPEIPPLPAIVGEGCPVDLLRLFCLVKDRGGYRSVTVTQSWHAVSESVGLGPGFGPAVKLVYSKYLGSLERWAQSFPKKNSGPTLGKAGSRSTQHANDKSALNGAHLTGELPLHKRKRDATIGMLNWLRAIAKKPCDVSYKICSSLKDAKSGKSSPTADYFTLAMMLRREMFIKKIRKDYSVNHPKQVTPLPSSSNSKKTRTSPRLKSTALPPVTLNPSSTKQHSIPVPPSVSWLSMDEESDIPVGPNHQADIPDFTDHVSMSDPITLKYLGTSFWSPNHKIPFQASKTPIGEAGISKSCKCSIPGSSECIRLHVAESKLKLKCELGNSFYTMGFHKMGEEVALSWTQKEEEKFKSIIRANLPSDDKKFWPPLFVNFRSKGWKGLVSYYYNVFLLRRRRYQNKAVPVKIDSDDDDIESGFLDGDLDASRVCAENRQCVNMDP